MKKQLIWLFPALFFSSCELFENEFNESEEEMVVPITKIPEVSLISVDPYRFTVEWERMESVDGYDIEWWVTEKNRGNLLSGSSFSVGPDEVSFTSDTWMQEVNGYGNQVDFCGNIISFSIKASKSYSSETVYSQPAEIQFSAPACDYQLEVVGENTFDICNLPEDNSWQNIRVLVRNNTYDRVEPFNCAGENCNVWDDYRIKYSLVGTDQPLVDYFYLNYNEGRILGLNSGCWPACGDAGSSTGFYFDQDTYCGKGAGLIKLEYFLVHAEKDSIINSINFTFNYN